MATNLSTCHPGDGIEALNRLPGLAEPLLQIDLERELQQLRQEDSWQRETGRSSKTLAKYPDFRIVLILMKSGTRMRQHRAEGRISIQQLKGQVCIHLADRKVNVSAGHLLVLDCGVLHDVEALEESALLLTISWRREKSDASESFSSTQRHLDEEAVSRMDDEGGAPDAAVSPLGAAQQDRALAARRGWGLRGCNHRRFTHFVKEVSMATNTVLTAGQASKLIRAREEVAEGTMAFHFEKPTGFKFKAGQFADVTLIDPPETDAEGNTRTFSIASPPFENELVFTTRMRDTAFKRSLKKVPLATEVKIGSAAGSFTLHKNRQSQPCSSQAESESRLFSASYGKPITTASRTSCIFSIPIGGPKTHLSWTLCRTWRRRIPTST